MSMFVVLFMVGIVGGLVIVASNPSPYYAAFGLVGVSGMGCGLLLLWGGSFVSFIMFLIYLGGMLVVFAYCSALAADPYPDAWGAPGVAMNCLVYLVGVLAAGGYTMAGWSGGSGVGANLEFEWGMARWDMVGAGWLYASGGWLLMVVGWALLLTLFVVLEVVRGLSRGTLRVVK